MEDLDGPVARVTAPDVPIPFTPPLERAVLPQVDDVKEAAVSSSPTEHALVEVTMPQMGVSVAEGTIAEWKKRPGDWVERDETIVEISTDKIETEIPSPAAGRVARDPGRGRRDRAGRRRCSPDRHRLRSRARPHADEDRAGAAAEPRRRRRREHDRSH